MYCDARPIRDSLDCCERASRWHTNSMAAERECWSNYERWALASYATTVPFSPAPASTTQSIPLPPFSRSQTMSSPRPHPPDRIRISDLQLHLPHGLGPSAFGLVPAPPCPALLSLEIELDDSVVPSCTTDDTMGGLGINYSSTSKALIALCEGRAWSAPEELVRAASSVPLQLDVVRSVRVRLELPKALLPARAAVYSALFARGQMSGLDTDGRGGSDGSGGASRAEAEWECEVKDLRVRTIIGLHPHERQMRQWLEVDVGVQGYAAGWDHRLFAEGVYDVSVQAGFARAICILRHLWRYISGGTADCPSPCITRIT